MTFHFLLFYDVSLSHNKHILFFFFPHLKTVFLKFRVMARGRCQGEKGGSSPCSWVVDGLFHARCQGLRALRAWVILSLLRALPTPPTRRPQLQWGDCANHMKTCSREHGGELGQSRRVSQRQWPLKYVKI